jgi:hypothetical protein
LTRFYNDDDTVPTKRLKPIPYEEDLMMQAYMKLLAIGDLYEEYFALRTKLRRIEQGLD